ncbi:efflux RND transporter periplasmic adaptor subunit [Ruminococcus sp.]|uniref:efflux RND transporter periplasmic adaptor subunit n=1 Tax=Ruminococcus sp. TaxID=41978 RepID=UPI0026000EEB|nr:efflux RND transporter periplasmic adaptor subunit [Ruminococcus sp.]
MTTKKRICTVVIVVIVVCALCLGGFLVWKKVGKSSSKSSQKVYVQKVSSLNTVSSFNVANAAFSGVVEAQESVDVKYDTSKTIDEILVKDGDTVKKGDKLLTYDVEAINLQLDQAKLEVERLQNEITSNKNQIAELEKEKKTADQDAAVSYTTQILSLQSDNAKNEYDIKAKNVEIKKLEASTKNAFVTASIDGTVKNVTTPEKLQEDGGTAIMQITAEGDYRVKGTFNEQSSQSIAQNVPVIIKSRLDDTTWKGEITKIDTNPQKDNNDMYDYGNSDDMTTSSNYAFYVTPESLDGLMLGQHVLIEIDNGQDTSINKTGIWLYSDFICKDGDKSFVWAKDKDGEIEKRYVEIGEKDEDNGDCEIKSGLENDDYIAYPNNSIEEGMTATTNESDVSVAPNDLTGGDNGDGDMDMTDIDGDYDINYDGSDDTLGIDEDMLPSMTDEEIEAYFNSLYGDESGADNADNVDNIDDTADNAEPAAE